jgi:YidC/Oxa1 family membrane protein insertase
MLQPGAEHHLELTKKNKPTSESEEQVDMATSMQQQMLYMMPLMTLVMSLNFQSGLVLYWVISTVYSAVQQYFFSGLGGLAEIPAKINALLNKSK